MIVGKGNTHCPNNAMKNEEEKNYQNKQAKWHLKFMMKIIRFTFIMRNWSSHHKKFSAGLATCSIFGRKSKIKRIVCCRRSNKVHLIAFKNQIRLLNCCHSNEIVFCVKTFLSKQRPKVIHIHTTTSNHLEMQISCSFVN